MFLIVVFSVPVFLLIEHPVFFWLVFVPLMGWIIITVVNKTFIPLINEIKSYSCTEDSFVENREISFFGDSDDEKHSGKCDGDCANCPPHYGYRYGRWYYGHSHTEGCEFGGNKNNGGRD